MNTSIPTLAQIRARITEQRLAWHAAPSRLSPEAQVALLMPRRLPVSAAALPGLPKPLPPRPTHFDWRDVGGRSYVTPAKMQDGPTCVAYAVTAAVESWVLRNEPVLPDAVDLSERTVISCNDRYPGAIGSFVTEIGIPPQRCFPAGAAAPVPGWQEQAYRVVEDRGFAQGSLSIEDFARLIAHEGPVLTGMNVPGDFFSYGGGVYSPATPGVVGFHQVLAIGFDDAAQCFIVKNSWDRTWGEDGCFRIAYQQFGEGSQTGFGVLNTVYTGIVPPRRRSFSLPITLRTCDGHTVTVVDGGGLGGPNTGSGAVAVHTDARVAGAWEVFGLDWVDGMWCTLRTMDGSYLTAVDGGGVGGANDATCPVHTDATWASAWEQLTLNYDAVTATATIQTPDGHFLTAVNGGGVGRPVRAPLHTDARVVGPWEKFQVVLAPSGTAGYRPKPGRTYRVVSKGSGKVLDISGAGPGNGAAAIQWDYLDRPNQHWTFVDAGAGSYQVRAQHSGRVLDVSGRSTLDGAPVQQWDWLAGTNQRWLLLPQPDGSFAFQALHSGLVLDVSGRSTSNGAQVQQWQWLDGDNQKWWIDLA